MLYTIENLKKKKERELAQCVALKKAWEDVSFPTKKDGAPFKNMAKNFKNAKYYIGACSLIDCNYILKVDTVANYSNGTSEYISDELHCSKPLRYVKNPINPINPDNIRKQGLLVEDQYLYDLEEIKKILIPNRVAFCKKRIAELSSELQKFDKTVTEVEDTVSVLRKNGSLFMEILKKII